MILKNHTTKNGKRATEVIASDTLIDSAELMLEIMTGAGDCELLIMYQDAFHPAFFDLSTRLAGEILQKFSNYRLLLAIIGDFTSYDSKSLQDFIRESNRLGVIRFVGSLEEALGK